MAAHNLVYRTGTILVLMILVSQGRISAQPTPENPGRAADSVAANLFKRELLQKVPEVFPADGFQAEGVKALFYRGLDYTGRPSRVFAYYGTPANATVEKLPAMVLIHGGGGTAFANWVKLWNSRGYAAISMDLCGCVPEGTYGNWKRQEHGGPPGWDASFYQLNDPLDEQWTCQAVSAVMLANTLIRSFPEVDPERIGVTGISWGGYLTCIVAGADPRFRFACPVYGCGFLGENSVWLPTLEKIGPEQARKWLSQWDPSQYLRSAKMPILWVNGTNDFAYPMDSWQKSYLLPTGARTLCLRVRMPHGHGAAGENPAEIHMFANSILRRGTALPQIVEQGVTDQEVWATFQSEQPVSKAELAFTLDLGKWSDRKWETQPAEIDRTSHRIRAEVPAAAKVYYLNLYDDRDCVVSTKHVER